MKTLTEELIFEKNKRCAEIDGYTNITLERMNYWDRPSKQYLRADSKENPNCLVKIPNYREDLNAIAAVIAKLPNNHYRRVYRYHLYKIVGGHQSNAVDATAAQRLDAVLATYKEINS